MKKKDIAKHLDSMSEVVGTATMRVVPRNGKAKGSGGVPSDRELKALRAGLLVGLAFASNLIEEPSEPDSVVDKEDAVILISVALNAFIKDATGKTADHE